MKKITKLFFLFFCLAIFFLATNPAKAELLDEYDLRIVSMVVKPESPKVDEVCTITVTIMNNSNYELTDAEFAEEYKISFANFELTGTSISPMSTSKPIAIGSNYTYAFSGKFIGKGQRQLIFEIDPEGKLEGLYPRYTRKELCVDVLPADDLELISVEFIPEKPVVNQTMYILVGIKNTGKVSYMDLEGIRSIDYNFPNFNHNLVESPDIHLNNRFEPGETEYYKYEGRFTKQGSFSGYYIVDAANRLDEFNEENNRKDFTFNVVNKNDVNVAFDSFYFPDKDIIKGEDTEIVFKFKNTGAVSLVDNKLLSTIDIKIENFIETTRKTDEMPTMSNPFEKDDIFEYTVFGSFVESGYSMIDVSLNKYEKSPETDYKDNASTTKKYVYRDQEEVDYFEINYHDIKFASSTFARLSWETSKSTRGEATVGPNQYSSGMQTYTGAKSLVSHTADFDNLKAGTTYYYQIKAINNGTEKTTGYVRFQMPADNAINKIGEIVITKNLTKSTAVIKWQTDKLADGFVYYRKKGIESFSKAGGKGLKDGHEVLLSRMAKDQVYELYVTSADGNGRNEFKSDIITFVFADSVANGPSTPAENQTQSQIENQTQAQALTQTQASLTVKNKAMYGNLRGSIVLTVEANGEAYYVSPTSYAMYYLGRPKDAFAVMRGQGIGISNADLEKIPLGIDGLKGEDTDGDGLPDLFEDAIGTQKNNIDSDGDVYSDKSEIISGYDPRKGNGRKMSYDRDFAGKQKGKIFIQVEGAGEAWYVNPKDGKRYFLGRPDDAFNVMRTLGLGISDANFESFQK